MRHTPNLKAEPYRVRHGQLASTTGYGNNGAFRILSQSTHQLLHVIVSDQDGWDHVSASYRDHVPTWQDMCQLKNLFFTDQEWVVQYHPALDDYINHHPYVLHLWRPQHQSLPTPPKELV